jgi:hypothetical protein
MLGFPPAGWTPFVGTDDPDTPRVVPISTPDLPGSVLVTNAMAMASPSLGASTVPQILRFNGYGEYSGLLYHSPHSVVFQEELYPTALHLFEACKFLDHRPDLADHVRQCERIEDVTVVSAGLGVFTRLDWGTVALFIVSNLLFYSSVERVCLGG